MEPICTPLDADLFLFCFERDFMRGNGIVSTKIYDRRDDFDFDKFPFP